MGGGDAEDVWQEGLAWQAFLEEVTAGIGDNGRARRVREELRAHLEDTRRALIAGGARPAAAAAASLAEMGEAGALRAGLAAVHGRSRRPWRKSAEAALAAAAAGDGREAGGRGVARAEVAARVGRWARAGVAGCRAFLGGRRRAAAAGGAAVAVAAWSTGVAIAWHDAARANAVAQQALAAAQAEARATHAADRAVPAAPRAPYAACAYGVIVAPYARCQNGIVSVPISGSGHLCPPGTASGGTAAITRSAGSGVLRVPAGCTFVAAATAGAAAASPS